MRQMGEEKSKKEVVEEYLRGGISLRQLSRKYGMAHGTVHRWIRAHERGEELEEGQSKVKALVDMPKDVRRLQRELYEARLEAKLYRTMVEVAEKDLGIVIRKKSGAR